MTTNRFLALATAGLLAGSALAQNCTDNLYPVNIVDAAGNLLPTEYSAALNENVFLVPTEDVYLAFDPALPSGLYYVHVTDTPINGMDEVVSTNDPLDRFVQVTNTNGVITLSLPMSNDPSAAVYGAGLNGVGQSIRVNPFTASQYSQCEFKLWFGDNWDLSQGPNNPYLLVGGIHPQTGACAVRSYHSFRVGDGDGSDVCGIVFADANQNGVQDAGEAGLPGWSVSLVNGGSSTTVQTDATGTYCFENVGAGSFTVELTMQAGYVATTALVDPLEVCACAPVAGADFGVAMQGGNCNARTPGYWRNKHGREFVVQNNVLAMLPALNIVDAAGNYVSFANVQEYASWLRRAEATNMAYMLSAHLVAMHNNVLAGFVDSTCMVNDPQLGAVSIAWLMQEAVASLGAHPYTPVGHAERAAQEALKNALDRANNNETWM